MLSLYYGSRACCWNHCRIVHVVLALLVATASLFFASNLTVEMVFHHFNIGLVRGAVMALSYVMVGVFANLLFFFYISGWIKHRLCQGEFTHAWSVLFALFVMSFMSQNIVPVHIAFIPLVASIVNDIEPATVRPASCGMCHDVRSHNGLCTVAC